MNRLIFHTEKKTYFLIDECAGEILLIHFSKRKEINNIAHWVYNLRLTEGRTRVEGDILYIDALGFIDMLAWLYANRTNDSSPALAKRIEDYFAGDPFWSDISAAACRAVYPLPAQGDQTYFRQRAIDGHPIEFAELQAFAALVTSRRHSERS